MRHLLRRVGFYLVALWAAITFNFIIPRLMPGDPAEAYIARLQGQRVTRQELDAIRKLFGVNPNVPLWQQYLDYLNGLLHGNLGIATSQFPTTVIDVLKQSLPWTIGLVGAALIISFLVGTLIGMVIAWKRGSWYDTLVPPFFTFLSAVPYFWMALALVYVFGVGLNWFPTNGGYDVFNVNPGWNGDFILSVVQHAILPVITLVIGSLAGWVLTMRNTMITTLSEDYVVMAEAKGLSTRRIMMNYAARNAILPSITSFSISLGLVVSGALLTEIVFNYPGIGYALYQAVQGDDYALVEGCFLVIALAVLIANFLSELVYTLLDPRVRREGS
ncbi:MAG TPA: ABC transporter permease [Ktedonobacteraceae bacterium]|nr:ABC transporter permease [Ktedonobacteraceae bacterium]